MVVAIQNGCRPRHPKIRLSNNHLRFPCPPTELLMFGTAQALLQALLVFHEPQNWRPNLTTSSYIMRHLRLLQPQIYPSPLRPSFRPLHLRFPSIQYLLRGSFHRARGTQVTTMRPLERQHLAAIARKAPSKRSPLVSLLIQQWTRSVVSQSLRSKSCLPIPRKESSCCRQRPQAPRLR